MGAVSLMEGSGEKAWEIKFGIMPQLSGHGYWW
ncbi:hypothetical protein AX13_07765 [Comamonas aquatica DA1877]|uniref:Uncharacterized protein n=1 Tax=Comamonas aquatica DA1877 TaxID=1457173 RepID=A0A014MLZ9_9BURK|nr:hypothetical protein AX13_07765 [Comamonas aquatica DA1877]